VKVPNRIFALRFLLKSEKKQTDTYQLLQQAYGKASTGRTQIFDWFRGFTEGTLSAKQNKSHVTGAF